MGCVSVRALLTLELRPTVGAAVAPPRSPESMGEVLRLAAFSRTALLLLLLLLLLLGIVPLTLTLRL